jgi:SAM-dependent methyltransferase
LDQTYAERYRELYERHWWWRARNELITSTLDKIQPAGGWKSILDIGCGDGLYFDHLTTLGEVAGVEPSPDLVSPNNPYRDRIYIGPFDENFQPGTLYKLILMLDVLEHLENPSAGLQHVSRLLASGGRLVVTAPALMALWTSHDAFNHHFTRYTKPRLVRLAEENGFEVLETRYLYHWTCPVKLGSAWLERLLPSEPKPAALPPGPLNELLYFVTRIEQQTLSRLPMPFGSSLMMIAKRSSG